MERLGRDGKSLIADGPGILTLVQQRMILAALAQSGQVNWASTKMEVILTQSAAST